MSRSFGISLLIQGILQRSPFINDEYNFPGVRNSDRLLFCQTRPLHFVTNYITSGRFPPRSIDSSCVHLKHKDTLLLQHANNGMN